MKNRKTVVIAFLLCAMMLIGVGFAAISGSLTITGNLTSGVQAFDVVFTQVELTTLTDADTTDGATPSVTIEKSSVNQGGTVELNSGNGLPSTSFTVKGLATKNDAVVLTFTIKNNNKVAMQVTPEAPTAMTNFSADDNWDGAKVIEAGATETYQVIVKLTNEAISSEVSDTFTIKLNATSEFTPHLS